MTTDSKRCPLEYWGVVKLINTSPLIIHYQAQIGLGFPAHSRLLKRKLETWSIADYYGIEFIKKWNGK